MIAKSVSYKRHRYPPEIIARTVWLYFRFPLSLRLVEDMLLERGIVVSYETIRRWARKFGPDYAKRFRRKPARPDDIWHLDEVVITIAGRKQFERDLLVERTQAGLARAKAEGKALGRRASLSETRKKEVLQALADGMSIAALARKFATSRQTIMRVRNERSHSVRA